MEYKIGVCKIEAISTPKITINSIAEKRATRGRDNSKFPVCQSRVYKNGNMNL